MTPELLQQLATTFGIPGALLIYMIVSGRKADEPGENPVKEVVSKLDDINSRLIRVETILVERK